MQQLFNISSFKYLTHCNYFFINDEGGHADYGKLKKQVKEYDVIKQNIDSILKVERQPERAKETERG